MCPGQLKGCSRGVYGLASWTTSLPVTNGAQAAPPDPPSYSSSSLVTKKRILAKYQYVANTDSPLGNELSLSQQQKLWFIEEHAENSLWWLAEDDDGHRGYIPKNYVMVLEDQAGGLPWLQKKEDPQAAPPPETTGSAFGKPAKMPVKPYRSSYNHPGLEQPKPKASEYVCKICEKELNGPQPYNAHMASKAHREMVEYLSRD